MVTVNRYRRLNLGCGSDYREDYINADRVPGRVDVVLDLDRPPYPFPDNSITEVLMKHVLEHLEDIRAVMDELWRILRPQGVARIYVPHFSHFQALTHPEHRHAFHYNSMAMFTPSSREPYTRYLWHIERSHLRFRWKPLEYIFNRHKYIYSATILAYLFPAYEIEFVMRPIK